MLEPLPILLFPFGRQNLLHDLLSDFSVCKCKQKVHAAAQSLSHSVALPQALFLARLLKFSLSLRY